MARFKNPLDHVRVAAPCKADWDQMIGSERMRFCGQCSLNVYNLSSMTRSEAESLIARNEGRLCIRLYRRRDGSIITKDCPVGLRAIRGRVSYVTKAVGSMLLGLFAGLGVHQAFTSSAPFGEGRTMGVMATPLNSIQGKLVREPQPQVMVGEMAGIPIRKRSNSGKSRSMSKD